VTSPRKLAAIVAAVVGLAASVAAVGEAYVRAAPVVVGTRAVFPQGAKGWGTPQPHLIDNGGDPNGRVWNLRWTGWGTSVARARGLTWIFNQQSGGYFAKPGVIELRASRLGRCTPKGPSAYTRLQARESPRPGGPLSPWFAWNDLATLCHRS
jgi:hypothetical protein